MKINNEKEIFDMFVGDCELRKQLQTPFIEKTDGRVWATNGRILIMVNPDCVSEEYKPLDMGGHLPVRDFNTDILILVSDIEKAFGKLPQEPEVTITYEKHECPECGGEGTVEAEYYANYDNEDYTISGTCPICDGSGELEEEIRTPTGKTIPVDGSVIKIGEGYFRWDLVKKIAETCKKLDITDMHVRRNSLRDMSIIELNRDIHIAIMPMYLEDEEGKKIKKDAVKVKGVKA